MEVDSAVGLALEVLTGAGIPGRGGHPRTSVANRGDSTSLYMLRVSPLVTSWKSVSEPFMGVVPAVLRSFEERESQ